MNTNSECNTKSIDNNRDSISSKNLNNNEDKEDGEIDEEEESSSSKNVYCICRTSDTSKFMIGCDKCEEWYHGICINITEHEAQRIQLFYCQTCRQKDQTLQIIYKERKTNKKKDSDPNPNQIKQKSINTSNNNNTYSNSNNNINTNPSVENSNVHKYERDPDYRPIESKTVKNYYESDDDEDDDYYESINDKRLKRHDKEKSSTYRRRGRPAKEKEDKRKKPYRSSTARSRHRKKDETNKKTHKKNKEHVIEVEVGPKQCYGPACVRVARKGSKYCSDECGIKLSTNRIYEILPHRIRQWQSTDCDADQRSHKLLEAIRNEQQEARRILNELDSRQKELEVLINCGKTTLPMTEEESNEAENEAESELSMYCVTCGHEINHKLALKHMERCYNKYESQTSFGSIFKTKIEGQTVFCDVFNPQQKTYCKRLRILCPEHSKDPKIVDDEVCGCPLVSQSSPFEHSGKFCRVLKKKCNKHHCWEKLRRAELDAERIQQWLKLDDLFEREQKIRYCMANRHGILGLMLHQTIVHDDNETNPLI